MRRALRPAASRGGGATHGAHRLTVDHDGAGVRLDVWLSARLGESRAQVQSWIRDGHVLLGGGPVRPSTRLKEGQGLDVHRPAPRAAVPRPQDLPLRIVHEDAHLLVVDKPAGLAVHPGAGQPEGTLVNALLHHVRDLSGVGGVLRPGIVHRLDRVTSGLLVVAKDDATHRALAQQFAERSVEKEYLAIVLGVPAQPEGRIEAAIGRDPIHRKRMSLRARRKRAALSSYTVVEALDGAALVRVRIRTGRTHQIRVHLSSIGHPVAGDATYGGGRAPASKRAASRAALAALKRTALHATRLSITHPKTKHRLVFESPLPEELADLVARLRF